MSGLLADLRFAWRTLLRNPGFTAVALLALALGIGANSAIFSVVNAVLLRPLPFADPDRLVALWESVPQKGWNREPLSYPDFADWREQSRSFERLAAYAHVGAVLGGDGETERISGAAVSADLFPLLGAAPAAGRVFGVAEDRIGGPPVVVLSHALWRRRFDSRPDLIGKEIRLDGRGTTVIGIMPAGFNFPVRSSPRDYWVPIQAHPALADRYGRRGVHYLRIVARLRPEATLRQASAELGTIARRLESQYPDTNAGFGAQVVPLLEDTVGDARRSLLVLLGAVGAVLLIACANVANLLLARATARRREIAVRAALGAGRARLVRQLLTESLVLALAGGALGLILALWGVDLLIALAPADLPRRGEIGLDLRVAGFTLGIALLTAVLFGLAPALRATRPGLYDALKEGGRSAGEGWRRNRLRSLLVVSEVALSLLLLIGAGLLIKSFGRLREVDPGLDPRNVLTFGLMLPRSHYSDPGKQSAFLGEALRRLVALPGVEGAAAVFTLPFGGSDRSASFVVEGHPEPDPGQAPDAHYRSITPDYFRVMGIPLHRGRVFSDRDAAGSPRVIIVNETLARRFFPHEDPLGRRIAMDDESKEIVGVVGDVRHGGLHEEAGPEYYLPYTQSPEDSMTFVVRSRADPAPIAAAARREIGALDPELAVHGVRSMESWVDGSVSPRRFQALLLGLFAAVALASAAVGLYGVIAYSVSRRTREIGIRMALGAQGGDVVRLVVAQGMALALVGACLGLLGAGAASRILAGLLYEVSPTDPATFVLVPLLIVAVAFCAAYLPARRAARVDPMVALRCE